MELSHQPGQATKGKMMLLFLPLILFPFLSLLFWAAGGGQDNEEAAKSKKDIGLNAQLPEAQMQSGKATDKLSFYQQASKDSIKREEEKRNDPFWTGAGAGREDSLHLYSGGGSEQKDFSINYNPLPASPYASNGMDANEAKVYQKLAKLNSALAQSKDGPQEKVNRVNDDDLENTSSATDTKKLEAMMHSMDENGNKDPELEQLNSMLDKIAAIQHPDDESRSFLANDSLANRNTLAVRNKKKPAIVSLLQSETNKNKQSSKLPAQKAGFYNDVFAATVTDTGKVNTFQAIIPQTQVIVSGGTVQLQLIQDIDINGTLIKKGSYVFGTTTLSDERLQIKISSIQWNNNVYPVSLDVYDMDGLAGVYVPGSLTRETAKQSVDRAVSGVGLTTLDPSLGAQAASAGIEAVKSLVGKKAKLIKVMLPAGYQVLLKDNH